MRFGWKAFWFASCLAWGGRAPAAAINTAPHLEYSQDGTHYTAFDVLSGRQKVKNLYGYFGLSGHPFFGTVREAASAAMYWDAKRKVLSLIVINGAARHGFRNAQGDVKYSFSGLTSDTYVSMKDDPGDIDYKRGATKGSAHFQYKSSTDGLVFSGLEQKKLAARVSMTPQKGITKWRLVDGDPTDDGQFVTLDWSKPLYFRQVGVNSPVVPPVDGSGNGPGPGSGPGVPEPSVGLLGAGALGLLINRRRR